MTDENKQQREVRDALIPPGVRARNRTMILGSGSMSAMRAQVERTAPVQTSTQSDDGRRPETHDAGKKQAAIPSSSQAYGGGEDFVSPLSAVNQQLEPLDKIFRRVAEPQADGVGDLRDERVEDQAHSSYQTETSSVVDTAMKNVSDDLDNIFEGFDVEGVIEETGFGNNFQSQIAAPPLEPDRALDREESIDKLSHLLCEDILPSVEIESAPVSAPASAEIATTIEQQPVAPRIVRSGETPSVSFRQAMIPAAASEEPLPQEQVSTVGGSKYQGKVNLGVSAMEIAPEEIFWNNTSPLVGFLITYDHNPLGSYVELHSGRLVVSCNKEESGNCLTIRDKSVSPMHAIVRVSGSGVVQVLDQLSESGTRVKHVGQRDEEFLSGDKTTLSHGDIIFFGDRKFHVLLINEAHE